MDKLNVVHDNDNTMSKSEKYLESCTWCLKLHKWCLQPSNQGSDPRWRGNYVEWMVWKFPAAVPNFRALIIKPFWHFTDNQKHFWHFTDNPKHFWHFTDNQKHFWHFPFRFLFDFLQIYIPVHRNIEKLNWMDGWEETRCFHFHFWRDMFSQKFH